MPRSSRPPSRVLEMRTARQAWRVPVPEPSEIAYLVPPLRGEALDSWVEHLALNSSCSVSQMSSLLRLSPNNKPFGFVRDISLQELDDLSSEVGFAPEILRATTLMAFAPLSLTPLIDKRGHAPGIWTRGSGSRFCPECLLANGGRWKLRWYLHWTFACVEHRSLLHDRCEKCGTIPRSRARWASPPVPPDRMGCEGGCSRRTLSGHTPRRLFDGHPLLRLQSDIDDVLDLRVTTHIVAGTRVTARIWLADMSLLVRRLLLLMGQRDLHDVITRHADYDDRGDLLNVVPLRGAVGPLAPARAISAGIDDAGLMGVASVLAASMLDEPDVGRLKTRLFWVQDPVSIRTSYVRPEGLCSPALYVACSADDATSALAEARRTIIRAEFTETHPESALALSTDYLPASLPVGDTATLGSTTLNATRSSAISALIATGGWTKSSYGLACSCLDIGHAAPALEQTWHDLANGIDGDDLFREALSIRLAILKRDRKIHFGRRRHTFDSPRPLSKRAAADVASQLREPNTAHLRTYVSYFVWELLTGSSIELHPDHISQYGHVIRAYRRRRAGWVKELPTTILRLAERQLLRHKIDEPIAYRATRRGDGSWKVDPVGERTLPGWENRALRGSPRFHTPGQLRLATPDQVAIYVAHEDTPLAKSLRMALHWARQDTMLRNGDAADAVVELFLDVTGRHPLDLISWPEGSAPRAVIEAFRDVEGAIRRLGPGNLGSAGGAGVPSSQNDGSGLLT